TYLYPGGPRTMADAYDESGTRIRRVTYSYGPEGELLSVAGDTGEPIILTYDAMYRLTGHRDGKNQNTSYAYNAAGYLASVTYPGGDTLQFPSYDNNGNPTQRIDGRGIVTNYIYNDVESRLTDIQYPAAYQSLNVHLDYDSYGRIDSRSDGTGTQTYSYDDRDAPLTITTTYAGLPAGSNSFTLGYDYWRSGDRKSLSTPAGSFSYTYDGDNRLSGITNPYGESFSWTYLNNGWLASQQSNNATGSLVNTAFYTYNARGLLTDLTNKRGDNTLRSEFGSLFYDGVGNLLTQTPNLPEASAYSGKIDYWYDTKDQLTQEHSVRNGGYTFGFAYDAAGNPTSFKGIANFYNADNQNSGSGYVYDGNGNPTTYRGTAGFSFDPENRLTGIGSSFSAGYAAGGFRAWKQTTAGTTYYLYDGLLPVCELNSYGTVAATNTFGGNGLLARRDGSSHFYTFDPLGHLAQLLDATGTPNASVAFDAYGSWTSTVGKLGSPFGYGGQAGYYTDSETGLVLLGWRYYDPGTGRFLTRDPIGSAGGLNLYRYVGNSPTNFLDPSGLFSEQDLGNFSAGFGDALSFGLTASMRDWLGIGGVDPCSGWYLGGQVAGEVALTLATEGLGAETAEAEVESVLASECFVAGTLVNVPVKTTEGSTSSAQAARETTQPVEQIKPGDTVASRNPQTGKSEYKRVVRTFRRTVYATATVELADVQSGHVVERLTGTPEHLVFSADRGLVPLGQLGIGSQIVTRAGPPLVVKSVSRQNHPEGVSVYNLEVEDDHTYFVGKANGGVWVHNTCPVGRGALSNVPELANDPFLARQPQVSGPKIDEMVKRLHDGTWNWAGREIKYNGNVIIDGHYSYIAARLAGIEPVMIPSTEPFARTFSWGQLVVDPTRWPGSY